MTERKSETNFLALKKENSLVKVGNSMQITDKLLSESKFRFLNDFKGNLILEYYFNFESYAHPILDYKNQMMIFLERDGRFVEFELEKFQIKSERWELYDYLNNPKFRTEEHIYNHVSYLKLIVSHLTSNVLFLANGTNELILYDFFLGIVEGKELYPSSYLSNEEDEFKYRFFIEFDESLLAYCIKYYGIDFILKSGRKKPKSKEYLQVLDKKNFEIKRSFDITDKHFLFEDLLIINDILYFCEFEQGFVFSEDIGNLDEDIGKIYKYFLNSGTFKEITIFKNAEISGLRYNQNNKQIICYSNFGPDYKNEPKLAILDQVNERINHIINFYDLILALSISRCGNYFGILLNNGDVVIYDFINYSVITKFHFEDFLSPIITNSEYGIDYEFEPHYIIIEFPNIYIGNRKVLKMYN